MPHLSIWIVTNVLAKHLDVCLLRYGHDNEDWISNYEQMSSLESTSKEHPRKHHNPRKLIYGPSFHYNPQLNHLSIWIFNQSIGKPSSHYVHLLRCAHDNEHTLTHNVIGDIFFFHGYRGQFSLPLLLQTNILVSPYRQWHLPCYRIGILISQDHCSNFDTYSNFSDTRSGLPSLLPFMWLSSLVVSSFSTKVLQVNMTRWPRMLSWQNPLSGAWSLVCEVLGENFQYIWRAPLHPLKPPRFLLV